MMASAAANLADSGTPHPAIEQRSAPRFTSLIRVAKLVCGQGEFVCVLRDVSSTGVRLRCFHALPRDPSLALALPNGEIIAIECVREDGLEASFRFGAAIPVERLMRETRGYPRRQLRLAVAIPLMLHTRSGPVAAVTENIAQQGCRLTAAVPLALAQPVLIEGGPIAPIRAKVRWRRDGACGLVFDDTFSLPDFARLAARLQAPALVAD